MTRFVAASRRLALADGQIVVMCYEAPEGKVAWQWLPRMHATVSERSLMLPLLLTRKRSTLCLKKFPPLKSLQLCQILTDFQNFCFAGKRMKFVTKFIRHYSSHHRHVTTLPWEIKNSNFLKIFSTVEENANKLHFKCTDFYSSMRVCWACLSAFIKILFSSLNIMMTAWRTLL